MLTVQPAPRRRLADPLELLGCRGGAAVTTWDDAWFRAVELDDDPAAGDREDGTQRRAQARGGRG
jgi:hypothetical protein